MIGIYKVTSPTGKIYIGQSIDIEKRIKQYRGGNCINQRILYNSILKYGWTRHKLEILEHCDICELNDKERYYQDLFNAIGKNGLNCKLTKSSDRSGKYSKETRIKIGLGNKGKKVSKEGIINMAMDRRNISSETRLKMSLSQKKRTVSLDTRVKMSIAKKGIPKDHFKKIILDLSTGVFFTGLDEASSVYGIKKKTLQRHLSGFSKNKTNLIYT